MGCRTATPALVATSPVSDGKRAPPAWARTKMKPARAAGGPSYTPPCQSSLSVLRGVVFVLACVILGEGVWVGRVTGRDQIRSFTHPERRAAISWETAWRPRTCPV